MVEFGLKLEDNKVAAWSDHYLRYEMLKEALARAKKAQTKLDNLKAKRPDLYQTAIESLAKGLPTPKPSRVNLLASPEGSSVRLDSIEETESEQREPLLNSPPRADSGYGAVQDTPSIIKRSVSTLSDYLGISFERQVRDASKDLDKNTEDFDSLLVEDVEKVNAFYNRKLADLQGRLDLLKDGVAQTFSKLVLDTEAAQPPQDEYLETPLVRNRKRGIVQEAVEKIQRRSNKFLHRSSTQGSDNSQSLGDEVDEDIDQDLKQEKVQRAREIESIQRALMDLYRRAKLLQNFAIMNYTGFIKIVKKHDKTLKEHKGRYRQLTRAENICNEGKAVEKLAEYMERLYAAWFCERNLSEARAQLLPKRGDGLEMDWSQMRLGYRMGMCSVLGLWVCWDSIWGVVSHGDPTIGGRTAFPVFRACGGLLLLQWCWGCSVWIWTRYRINYIFLFDFNPNMCASPLVIFNEAVDHSLVFLSIMLLYYKAGGHAIPLRAPAGIFPLILVLYTICNLLLPWRTRRLMWSTVWGVVTAPRTSPTFFDGYVGDIFTSMVKVFQDWAWTLGFALSGDWLLDQDIEEAGKHRWSRTTWYKNILIPLLTLMPLVIRFNQCLRRFADTGQRFPHLANAFKYAVSQTVTLFGAFHPLYMLKTHDTNTVWSGSLFQLFWMGAFVSSSLYSFTWDVYMDWGLGRPKFNFLGPRLMYPKQFIYYAIIATDLVLRFAWVLTLVPPNSGADFALPQYLTAVSMILELFRRTIWGFLRLENEHRNNTSGYRRVDFVPLHFSTEHTHGYKQEKEHRGSSVLFEVVFVTVIVLAASVASVVAAQHQTEILREQHEQDEL